MKRVDKSYLSKKINKLNKKIHRAEDQVMIKKYFGEK